MRRGADAADANGSQSNTAPSWNGSSASGTQAPEQMAWITARTVFSTHGPRSMRTVSTVYAMSMATPTAIARPRLSANAPRLAADAGRGSTPSTGASSSSGSETSSAGRAHSPTISAAYSVAIGIGHVNRVAMAPFQRAADMRVRAPSCAERTSAISEYVSTAPD